MFTAALRVSEHVGGFAEQLCTGAYLLIHHQVNNWSRNDLIYLINTPCPFLKVDVRSSFICSEDLCWFIGCEEWGVDVMLRDAVSGNGGDGLGVSVGFSNLSDSDSVFMYGRSQDLAEQVKSLRWGLLLSQGLPVCWLCVAWAGFSSPRSNKNHPRQTKPFPHKCSDCEVPKYIHYKE